MSREQVAMPSGSPPDEGIDPRVWRIVAVLILGAIMSVLDTSIVNVALESLSRDLDSPLSDVQWVVSGYLLASHVGATNTDVKPAPAPVVPAPPPPCGDPKPA